jgi:hypothetical protein
VTDEEVQSLWEAADAVVTVQQKFATASIAALRELSAQRADVLDRLTEVVLSLRP